MIENNIFFVVTEKIQEYEDKFIEIMKKDKAENLEEMKIISLFSFNAKIDAETSDEYFHEYVFHKYNIFSNKIYKILYEDDVFREKIFELFGAFDDSTEDDSPFLSSLADDIDRIKGIFDRGERPIKYKYDYIISFKLFSQNFLNEEFVFGRLENANYLDNCDIETIYECFEQFSIEYKIKIFTMIREWLIEEQKIILNDSDTIDMIYDMMKILKKGENILIEWDEEFAPFNFDIIHQIIIHNDLDDDKKVLGIMKYCFSKFAFTENNGDFTKSTVKRILKYCKKLFEGKEFEFDYSYRSDNLYTCYFLEDNYFLQYINCEKLCDEQIILFYDKYGYFKEEYDKRNLNDNILQDV